MKKNYFILLATAVILHTTSWSQTSYGNEVQGNAGDHEDDNNSYFGYIAGTIDTGIYNTFIGAFSGRHNTTGPYNTFLGSLSGRSNNNGSDNTFIGYRSGYGNMYGDNNTFVGSKSGVDNTGSYNTFIGRSSGLHNTTGYSNTFIGRSSGESNHTGRFNAFIGGQSGRSNYNGKYNTFLGYQSGYNNTVEDGNTFIGYQSGFNINNGIGIGTGDGNFNTFLGYQSGYSNEGEDNVFIGTQSGENHELGNANIFIGRDSGQNASHPSTNYNIFIGHQSGLNGSGEHNISIGRSSGRNNTVNNNIFLGAYSGYLNTTGGENTFIGYQSGRNNIIGTRNTFLGHLSGYGNTSSYNTFIGDQSGENNTTGGSNTFLGYYSGHQSAGSSNVFLGRDSGENNEGSYNTFIGRNSGESNNGNYNTFIGFQSGVDNDAANNTFLGAYSGHENTTGEQNTFIGYQSGRANTTGTGNTYVGYYSGFENTASYNTFIGDLSGRNSAGSSNLFLGYGSGQNSSGNFNTFLGHLSGYSNAAEGSTFIGYGSGISNTTGENNTFIGRESGLLNTTGANNTFIGYQSGRNNTDGTQNTFLGRNSGISNTEGSQNTFLGYGSGDNNETGSGNVFLGYQAGYNETESNRLYIDNSDTSSPLIWGDFENDILQFNSSVRLPMVEEDIAVTADQILMTSSTDPNGTVVWRNLGDIGGDNGYNTIFEVNGANLEITDDGGTLSIPITDLGDNLGNHTATQSIIPDDDNIYDIGATGLESFSNIFIDGSLYVNDIQILSTTEPQESIAIGNGASTAGFGNSTALGAGAMINGINQVHLGNAMIEEIGGYANWSNLFSDSRFKKNVKEDIAGLEFIEKLRPVSYEEDRQKLYAFVTGKVYDGPSIPIKRSVGFIAQEVEQVMEENSYIFSGVKKPKNENDNYGLRYAEFVVPLTKAVQELSALVESQQQKIAQLESLVYGNGTTNPSTTTERLKGETTLPKGFSLTQNIPNPFDETTTIVAEIPSNINQAKIVIYNLQGIELQSYSLTERGRTSVEIKGGSLQSGIYLYALLADGQLIDTKKMILTK